MYSPSLFVLFLSLSGLRIAAEEAYPCLFFGLFCCNFDWATKGKLVCSHHSTGKERGQSWCILQSSKDAFLH